MYACADFVIGVSENALSGINTKKKVITNWWQPDLKKIKSNSHVDLNELKRSNSYKQLVRTISGVETYVIPMKK